MITWLDEETINILGVKIKVIYAMTHYGYAYILNMKIKYCNQYDIIGTLLDGYLGGVTIDFNKNCTLKH